MIFNRFSIYFPSIRFETDPNNYEMLDLLSIALKSIQVSDCFHQRSPESFSYKTNEPKLDSQFIKQRVALVFILFFSNY